MKKSLKSIGLILVAGAAVMMTGAARPRPIPASPLTPHLSASAVNSDQPAKKKIKIGVSYPAADHGWTAGVGWWVKRATALYPDVEWVTRPAADPQKQTADVEDMMVKGIDAMVILCTDSAPMTPVGRKLKEKGIFVVSVDRGFEAKAGEPQIADIFLEGDNKAFGRKSAEYIAKRMGEKGNLVILTGASCTVDTDRVNAAKEVFARFPDIKIVGQQKVDWNREKAQSMMENMLTKNPHIDAVWAQDDDSALGAIKAIKEHKREKEMWVFGGAGMKDVVKMVMDGDPMVPADMTYPPSMIAAGIHECVSAMRDGNRDKVMEFMPRHLLMDVELITKENAKSFYFPESVY